MWAANRHLNTLARPISAGTKRLALTAPVSSHAHARTVTRKPPTKRNSRPIRRTFKAPLLAISVRAASMAGTKPPRCHHAEACQLCHLAHDARRNRREEVRIRTLPLRPKYPVRQAIGGVLSPIKVFGLP